MTVAASHAGRAKRRRLRPADRRLKYGLVWPSVFVLLLVGLFPLIYSVVVSFQRVDMYAEDTSFHGTFNYDRLFDDPAMWEALWNTAVMTGIALPVELILGMLMALLFLDALRGRQIMIALLVLPTVISPLVAGAAWRFMFDNRFGPINQILGWFSDDPVIILWINNPAYVYPAILLAEVWQWTPFMFLLLLAALSNVDRSQIEAAETDGASPLRIFFRIVLPAIRPIMYIAILIRALDLFRLFDVVWALTKGGPGTMTETISTFAYKQGFKQFETSYTAAIAVVVILLLTVVVVLALKRVAVTR